MDYMYGLVFTSSKFSYYLLLLLSMPVILETQVVLQWWLGIVPEHTVAFVRLILVISMVDSLANPLIQAASATGRIRKYQSVVGTMLIMILPISYVALKLNSSPEGVFVVQLIVFCVALFARLWMLRSLIGLSLRAYCRKAVLPMASVTVASAVVPLTVYLLMQPSLLRFLLVCAVSLVAVAATVYCLGLTSNERVFIRERLKILKNKFRK